MQNREEKDIGENPVSFFVSLRIVSKKHGNLRMDVEQCRADILSENYRDFIVGAEEESRWTGDVCKQRAGELYQCIYVPEEWADPVDFGRYSYDSIPKCYALLGMEALEQAGILQLQNAPYLELMGNGVMLGFIDTGIRYEESIFRNLDGSTRVAGIWDQTIQTGEPPEGFNYGTEFGEEDLNDALAGANPRAQVPSTDTNGHGTFLASIAAGGADPDRQFLGAAPETVIGVVKLKPAKSYLKRFYQIDEDVICYQENDLMLGVAYLDQLARKRQLPLVLCIALGTNMGSHDGTSPLAGNLELFANLTNRALVLAGGNEANQRHHFLGRNETIRQDTVAEIRVGGLVNGFVAELWSDIPNLVSVTVESPSGERFALPSLRNRETATHQFVLERTVVSANVMLPADNTNSQLIFLRFQNPTEGNWKLHVIPQVLADGIFHIWLPVTEFGTREVYFLKPDPDTTITEPANLISGLTVGFFDGEKNSIAISSGRGYTKSNRIKPDLVAPGVDVTGLSTTGQIVSRSGSSVGAGVAAGATALLMEWLVYRFNGQQPEGIELRNLLLLGARKRPEEEAPNREWGYGRLDLYNTFDVLRRL